MIKDERNVMRSWCYKIVAFCLGLLLTSWEVGAQCTLDTNVVIQEIDTVNLIFEVEGAINNDLSDPSQGLCKVRIHFEHEFLGDLRLFLTSPGGQRVQLIGSEGNFGLTQFTEWNVCFIPDSEVPVPDPGFSPVWSNNQVWGSFGSLYTGSYHPFQGRLEDFNVGSVNGPWIITGMDRTMFYEGAIRGVELIFCDDDGLSCDPCDPGDLTLDIDRGVFCEGEDINVNASLSWRSTQPDPDNYSQSFYLLDDANIVLDSGANLILANPRVGNYLVCATSYFTGDTAEIPDIGDNWVTLERKIRNGEVCAAISLCREVLVLPSDTTRVQLTECGVDSVEVNGQFFDSTGRYYINELSRFGCDSVIELDLFLVDIDFEVMADDSLDCETDSVLLTLQDLKVGGPYEVEWRHEQGFLLDTISADSAMVFVAGVVLTIVSSEGCKDTVRTVIVRDSTIPEVRLFGDTITCDTDSIVLRSMTTALFPSYTWRKDGLQIGGDQDSIKVGEAGLYSLIVTDDNGCSARATYEVFVDTFPVRVFFQKDTAVCPGDSMGLALTGLDTLIDPLWMGPSGFLSTGQSIRVFDEGWYVVRANGPNGCPTIDSVLLTKGLSADSILLAQIPIECLSDGRISFWDFGTPLDEFTWITPSGSILRDSFVISNRPGAYILSSISSNGCSRNDTIILQDNRSFPPVSLDVDSIECIDDLGYASLIPDASVDFATWISPAGDTITGDSILLSGNGLYRVQVTGINGCVSTDSFEINAGRSPVIQLFGDTITCNNRGAARIWAVTNQSGLDYLWTHQGQSMGSDSILIVGERGWYKCSVSNTFGCMVMDSIWVVVDTAAPMVIALSPDTLNCRRSQVEIRTFVMPNLVQYSWSGPLGFVSTAKNPIVSDPGEYRVRVTSVNGCADSTIVSVQVDTLAPNPRVLVDTITCDNPTVNFVSDTLNPNWSWTWVVPGGDTVSGYPFSTSLAGDHNLILLDLSNGCELEKVITVAADLEPPLPSLKDTFIGCRDSTIVLRPQASGTFRSVLWQGPSGYQSDSLEARLTQAGLYIVQLTGENGCTGADSFRLELRNSRIRAQLQVEHIDCRMDSGRVGALVTGPVQMDFWLSPSGMIIDQREFGTDVPGIYTFIGESIDGCRDSLQIELVQDTIATPITLQKNGDFICERDEVLLSLDSVLDLGLLDLTLRNGSGDTLIWHDWEEGYRVREAGKYLIDVINLRNGCRSSDSISVSQLDDPSLSLDILLWDVWCPEVSDGRIDIQNIAGGYPPYRTQFNGLDYGGIRSFDRLRAGSYQLIIQDTFGCLLDSMIILGQSDLPEVDAGRDTTVISGTEVSLNGMVVVPPEVDYSILWWVGSSVVALDILSPDVVIDTTTVFRLEVVLENGCTNWDEVIVYVDPSPRVYVPNAFSPNSDDLNDRLLVFFGEEVSRVDFLEIYDRWGEMVYAVRDVAPGNPDLGWDGTLDGQPLVPGVMVYRISVQDRNGDSFLYEGSVTLVK